MHAIERNLIHMKRALIIGGGPAGLTAAYELLKGSKAKNPPEEIEVIVLEESGLLGGISKTVNYNGNRMDMGGHRFFFKGSEGECLVEGNASSPGGSGL